MIHPLAAERTQGFLEFARGFLTGNPEDDHNIQVKIDHSIRVLEEAARITESEGMDPGLAGKIHLSALCHDMGRFPQYQRYKTFKDSESENHARLGVRALIGARFLDGLPGEVKRIVLGSVFLHNARFMPEGLPADLDASTRVVRDADKLDIIPVMLEHFDPETPHNPVVVLGARPNDVRYSEAVVAHIRARRLADFKDMVWANDFKLSLLSWIYDLNFRHSKQAFEQRGYIDQLFSLLPRDSVMEELRLQLRDDLKACAHTLD